MVRTKDFDPEQALDKAMKLFWRNGYERTSVSDLLETMGINRGSLYDTFGDKHTLFLSCLHKYERTYLAQAFHTLSLDTPVYPTLKLMFENVSELVHEDQANWGCLMVNTASELSLHDEGVAALVTAIFERLGRAFAQFLERGQQRGELPAELDTTALGRYFTASFSGIATMAKTNVSRDFLRDATYTVLSCLTQRPV